MLVTKEHLEQLVDNYAKNHNTFEVIGYTDGLIKALELVEKLSKDKTNIKKN